MTSARDLVCSQRERRPEVQDWLDRCRMVLFAHGYGLACVLQPADADDLLRWWESRGVLVRGKLDPTLSQRFLGAGGLDWPTIRRLHGRGALDCTPPSFFGWMPGPAIGRRL